MLVILFGLIDIVFDLGILNKIFFLVVIDMNLVFIVVFIFFLFGWVVLLDDIYILYIIFLVDKVGLIWLVCFFYKLFVGFIV